MSRISNCNWLGLLALMVVVCAPAAAKAAEAYRPAQFGRAAAQITAELEPPSLSEALPVVGVYCRADVAANGQVSNVDCYEKEGYEELRQQTETAVAGKTFQPAMVGGQAVPVRMHFRVVYSNLETQDPIILLPNLGNMQSRYGAHYVAPQERLDQPQWYQAYREQDWAEGQLFFSDQGRLTRLVAMIDEEGNPIAVRRIEAHGRHKRDAVEVEKLLRQSQFIPGFADGKPQRMQYVAVLHHTD